MRTIILSFLIFSSILVCDELVAMEENQNFKVKIKEKLKQVDISDGVSKEEAIVIAQNLLIDKSLDDILIVSKPNFIEKHYYGKKLEDYYIVWFPTTFEVRCRQGLEWGEVLVNKTTGIAEYIGEGPN